MNDETNDKLYELALEMHNHGFMIPELTPSIPLYRYRGNIDYALDEIKNEYIFLTPTRELNDPFDSSYAYTYEDGLTHQYPATFFWESCFFLKKEIWYWEVSKIFQNSDLGQKYISMREFFYWMEKEVKKQGYNFDWEYASKIYFYGTYIKIHSGKKGFASSFSETENSIVMWAYYANAHRGVCLRYEPQLLDDAVAENRSIKRAIKKVWYSKHRFKDSEEKFSPFIKSEEWSHEMEWRIFKNNVDNNKIKFPCLTAVYLGTNFESDDDFNKIISALSDKERKIELYKFFPSSREFVIKPQRIKY